MPTPQNPSIYHIVHVDRLPSIIEKGGLLCDSQVQKQSLPGSTIGMTNIKHRRLYELTLNSYPDLHVGDCVPFYFCPRAVMLYLIYMGNYPELSYRGGQESIIHLTSNLLDAVHWADHHSRRWAFTTSNAGAKYFQDYNILEKLDKIDWNAVNARDWKDCKEGKQAEFLFERFFPWELVSKIGVCSSNVESRVQSALRYAGHKPFVEVKPDWYYG